jgi:hypothetical protein
MNSPSSQLPPRHHRFTPFALVRRRSPRRRGTGREERRRRESEEEHHRSRSRTPPSSSSSSTHVAVAVVVFTATPVSFPRLHEHDAPEPFDHDPTLAYRFGFLIRTDVSTPPVSFVFISFPLKRSGMGRPVRVLFRNRPS